MTTKTGAPGPDPKYMPETMRTRLAYLVEELGEATAAAGKSMRWGLGSSNPELAEEDRETNAAWLERELADLQVAIGLVRLGLARRGQDDFNTNRSVEWRDAVDDNGRPTNGPPLADTAGCHHCFGPLNAKHGVGQYECPWCIARYPDSDEGVSP